VGATTVTITPCRSVGSASPCVSAVCPVCVGCVPRGTRPACDNGRVTTAASSTDDDGALRHVMVVGGTLAEWGELDDAQWAERVEVLGRVAERAGARWLTLRPFERGAESAHARPVHHDVIERGGCTVIVDPTPDGRDRLVVALRKLAENGRLDEGAVAAALLSPAATEPDLVLVLGTPEWLPSSLVWELAYCELVYLDIAWADLRAEHLLQAIDAFRHRHRRFGGLD
jgi:Putative undecaprenyl diphosphate synthase